MWWILSGLLILITWALTLILQGALPIWVAIVITAVIVVFMLVLAIYGRISASRAASALEKAIAQQGAQQALNAKPERRAEIQELQKQMLTGISALKSSKLGSGKRSGAAALYSLPWYMIIGPPGAGKTTAIKHSGLVFPHQDAGGGASVRGVGGTRNCDWWFTNEAILLDTAGRFTTESDDRAEWMAFLDMLRKYRSKRPINGVLVAVNVADLIDSNEQQIEALGKKLRARIDEVMTQLHMVVPVYVLFTKCDLIAGFNEIFGSLRKTDRGLPWGATLRLDMPKNDPGKIFDAEFDVLCKQIHAKALKRLTEERSREAREKIFQFPLEFSGIKRNLSELISATFQVNAFQGTPIFRGFYFTSGTQEGRPLDRVLGRMGAAMGLRPTETAVQQVIESKSYFLTDVFMKIVFPDGDVAARSASEVRRQWLMRVAISAAAAALAVIVAVPGVLAFFNNRSLVRDTEDKVRAAAAINWADNRPVTEKMVLLDPVLHRLEELDEFGASTPLKLGWGMYKGDEVLRPTIRAYVDNMQRGFVMPVKQRLEDKLKRAKGDPYITDRNNLKTYLMLSDVEHLDIEWATPRFVSLWAELLRTTSNVSEIELKNQLRPHVLYYLELLKDKRAVPLQPDPALVEATRKTLQSVPVNTRYYNLFVNALIEETYLDKDTKVYPPLSLGELFAGRQEVLKWLSSARYQKEKLWKQVEGPYTERGHYAVVKNVTDAAGLLEREQWVVPLGPDETADRIPVNLKRLADEYDQGYVAAWTDFLLDITVKSPATVKEAIELYTVLATAEFPYSRILRQLEEHTQWNKPPGVIENELKKQGNERIQRQIQAKTGFRPGTIPVDLKKMGEHVSIVPTTFKRTVEFAIPPAGGTGPSTDIPLAKYIARIEALRGELQRMEDATPNVDPRLANDKLDAATADTTALLQPFDDKARALLSTMLLTPFKIVTARSVPGVGMYRPPPPRIVPKKK
ncbi:MAG: type VI secretion system membrane subunit TssM [Byssovorax sp.]